MTHSSQGRPWTRIEAAHTKALEAGTAPNCVYHVGTAMVLVSATGFRCPVVSCPCCSGRTVSEEDDE
jgi:hypothetical protein